MNELLEKVYAYNRAKAAKAVEYAAKDELISRLEAANAEATERMRTIANLFSDTVWRLLPQSIKQYFEEYRQ